MHWSSRYIGTEWDPRERHCWAFCRRVWAEHFGLEVPEMPFDGGDARAVRRAFAGDPEFACWHRVEAPTEGDAVVMAQGAHPAHVGIWLDLGGVLHSIAGSGGIYTPRVRLRDIGYRVTGCWRRSG